MKACPRFISDESGECLQYVADMMENLYDFNFNRYVARTRCKTSWMATAFSFKVEGRDMDAWMKYRHDHMVKELAKNPTHAANDISGFEKVLIWA